MNHFIYILLLLLPLSSNGQQWSMWPCPTPLPITGTLSVTTGNTTQLTSATTGGTWSSSTTTVATIGTAGLVTGVAAGTSTISYTNYCGLAATATVTVTSSFVFKKFNPSRSANNTITSDSLTATSNNAANEGTTFCNFSDTLGLIYGEVYLNIAGGAPRAIFVGWGDTTSAFNVYLGRNGTHSWSFDFATNFAWFNNTPTAKGGTTISTAPAYMCFARNGTNGNAWYGVITGTPPTTTTTWIGGGNPATGTTPTQTGVIGRLSLGVSLYSLTPGIQVSLNLGSSALRGTIPAGYSLP